MQPFEYCRPANVAEALALLREGVDAKLLAGGQSLIPVLKLRVASVDTVIDINGLQADSVGTLVSSTAIGATTMVSAPTRSCFSSSAISWSLRPRMWKRLRTAARASGPICATLPTGNAK